MAETVTVRPFGVQFTEAIAYLKGKLPEVSVAWDDLAGPVHGKVFTVAGATKADLVRDLHQAVVGAIERGESISTFRKAFDQIVQRHGWTYNGKRGWRTALILNTNMRSAHMAGRWAQIQAAKKDRPYLQYRTAGDARVRPMHRQWNGAIYPVDDAFWTTHYPPNGWGCRCTVRSYGLGDLQARNLQVSEPFSGRTREVGTATGPMTDLVPEGIDPGWDHNVGQAWLAPELTLGQKLARLPAELRGPVIDKTISPAFQTVLSTNWKAFQANVKATGRPAGEAQIVGFFDSAIVDGLADKVPGLQLESTAMAVFDNRTTHLSGAHKAGKVSPQAWPQALLDELPQAVRNYRAVLWDAADEALVIVPQADAPDGNPQRAPKVVLRLNRKTKFGFAAAVVSLGAADLASLADTNTFQVLIGKLK